jgi:hypothetical protein
MPLLALKFVASAGPLSGTENGIGLLSEFFPRLTYELPCVKAFLFV